MSILSSCQENNSSKNKSEAGVNSETVETVTSETFIFSSASGRLAADYKFDIQIDYTLGLAFFRHHDFIDTCLFSSLTPEFVFYSHSRKDEFTWKSKKSADLWELSPVDGVTIKLKKIMK